MSEWIPGTRTVAYAEAPVDGDVRCIVRLYNGTTCRRPAVAILADELHAEDAVCKRHYIEARGITTGEGAHAGRGACWACGALVGNYHADGCVVYEGGALLVVGPSR